MFLEPFDGIVAGEIGRGERPGSGQAVAGGAQPSAGVACRFGGGREQTAAATQLNHCGAGGQHTGSDGGGGGVTAAGDHRGA